MERALSVKGPGGGSAGLTVGALDRAFSGTLEPVPLKLGYRVGLLLVAITTVLLPMLYIGLIGLAAYAVYLHAVHNIDVLSGRGLWGRLILYLGPIVIGGLLVLFMVKPLFTRPTKPPAPLTLEPERFPLLFAFVEHIRRAVGAPPPREIRVDCQVNASAGLRRGLLSLGGKDLVLTIGLPLISGMNLRQLAGVLAHEFGHFAQGSGMALTYLVRSVNAWFYRVVYERDEWDERLAVASEEVDFRLGVVLLAARFFIWVTRKILWLLMMSGHLIGTFMLRHMEFDADRYEARLSGSGTFAETALRMRVLAVGSQRAIGWLSNSWTEKRLCEDYASLVATSADTLPSELVERIRRVDRAPDKNVFDTHPPDSERIESALAENAPGIFTLELPARMVVGDYDALAREATVKFYETEHEIDVSGGQLVPLRKFVVEQGARDEADRVAESYLHGMGNIARPLPLPASPPQPAVSLADGLQRAWDARDLANEMAERLPKAKENPEDGEAEWEAEPDPDPALLRAVEEAVAARLTAGLSLLLSEALPLDERAQRLEEAATLYGVLGQLSPLKTPIEAVISQLDTTFERLQQHQQDQEDEHAGAALMTALGELDQATTALLDALPSANYPFDHAAGAVTLKRYATEDVDTEGPGAPIGRAQATLQRMFLLYQRLLARLAVIAQCAEQAAERP